MIRIKHFGASFSQCKAAREKTSVNIEKEEIKLVLFADDVHCSGNLREITFLNC